MMIVQHKVGVLSKFSRVARTAQQPEEGRSSKVLAHIIVTAQSTCSATTLGQRHVHTYTRTHTHTHYAGKTRRRSPKRSSLERSVSLAARRAEGGAATGSSTEPSPGAVS